MTASAGRHLFTTIAVVAGLAWASPPAAAAEWLKIDAGDFLVYTDATEKTAMKSAIRYAAYRAAFSELLLAPGDRLPPSVLIVFRKSDGLIDHTPPRPAKSTTKLLNYSIGVDGTAVNAFSSEGDSTEALTSTLEFETVWMLARLGYHAPLWMSQGAGKVLAMTSEDKGRWTVGSKRTSTFHYRWEELFGISSASQEYSGVGNYEYHNQIWTLMHWVMFKDALTRERFHQLSGRLMDEGAVDAVPAVMGTPLAGLRKEIGRHLKGWSRLAIAFDEAAFLASINVTPAPRAEVLVWTSEVLAAADKPGRAHSSLDQALALAPELAVVQEAEARRSMRENRRADAITAYRRAISAGTDNYVSYLESGRAHLADAHEKVSLARHPAGAGGDAAVRAVDELRRAVLLNRQSADALAAFGRALYYCPEVNDGDITLLRERARPGARGVVPRVQFAMVLSRVNRREAISILEEIISDPNITSFGKGQARNFLAFLASEQK